MRGDTDQGDSCDGAEDDEQPLPPIENTDVLSCLVEFRLVARSTLSTLCTEVASQTTIRTN